MNKDKVVEYTKISFIFLVIFVVFALSLEILGFALEKSVSSYIKQLVTNVTNPFIGFCFGVLATAILQSSSTITSLAVVLVATNTITLQNAIPIVFGSNIGTTFTCLVLSFSHFDKKSEFERGMTAALLHNLFNIICAMIFFSIEFSLSGFSRISLLLGQQLKVIMGGGFNSVVNPFTYLITPLESALDKIHPIGLLIASFCLVYTSLRAIVWFFSHQLQAYESKFFDSAKESNKYKTFLSGLSSTAIVHSSSTTTAFMIPLAATKKISLNTAFNFIIGANLGTTLTALSGSLSKSETSISVAIVHVMFNFLGFIIFFYITPLNRFIQKLASSMARFFEKNRIYFVAYIVVIFFLIPFVLIYTFQFL